MASTKSSRPTEVSVRRIVFFDGICTLCNRWVDFLLRRSTHLPFQIASLQGKTAEQLLGKDSEWVQEPLRSVVFYEEQEGGTVRMVGESDAVLRIFFLLGFPWSLISLLRIMPRSIRDVAYRLVARNRYRIFGKENHCRLPNPSERERLLD